MATVTIDALDWDDRTQVIFDALGGNPKRARILKTATRRSITKTVRYVRRQITRVAAAELGVAQKRFDKARVRVRTIEGDLWEARIWVGTDPYPAHRLGKVRWTPRMQGARAGRHLFPGTFAHRAPQGPIFRRVGRERLPIEVETVEVDEAMRANLIRIEREALRRYRTILAQEMNFELQKLLGRV